MKICFATHNAHKLREVNQILENYQVVGLDDIGCHDEIPETGTTLEENSKIKAEYVSKNYQLSCFADDTGLEVEALQGAPGVYSARYAGNDHDSEANMALLLSNMSSQTNRKARFRTVVTLILEGNTHQFEGIVQGKIIDLQRGVKGFGYDPIFVPDGFDQTFAEMPAEQKNSISHRGRAMNQLIQFLEKRK